MTADLIHQMRIACPKDYPLGELLHQAADALEEAEAEAKQYRCPINMEHASQFCSAGYCFTCLEQRYGDAVERAEKAEAEVATLRDYVNEDKADAAKWRALAGVDGPMNSFELWKDRAEAAEASLKEAVELLKPFAQVVAMERRAGAWDSVMVNVAHCRNAAGFLESATTEGGSDADQ
jgi:hypothetical protein